MGIFKKLLGRLGALARPPQGVNESFGLKLAHTPLPENLHLLAEVAVEEARRDEGVELDYTLESLRQVDKILIGYHDRGVVLGSILETVFCLGCYVGEVMRRSGGGAWELSSRPELLGTFPVLRDASGSITTPIVKAFKCVQNGEEDSVYGLAMLGGSLSHSGVDWESMGLPMEPTPENMTALAEHGVRIAGEEFGVMLDYSRASVRDADALIGRLRASDAGFQRAEGLVVCLGAYAGEVMIRANGGDWRPASGPIDGGFPGVCIDHTYLLSPVPRALDCFKVGEAKSVYEYCGSLLEPEH